MLVLAKASFLWLFFSIFQMHVFSCLFLVVSAVDCLERLVSEMT